MSGLSQASKQIECRLERNVFFTVSRFYSLSLYSDKLISRSFYFVTIERQNIMRTTTNKQIINYVTHRILQIFYGKPAYRYRHRQMMECVCLFTKIICSASTLWLVHEFQSSADNQMYSTTSFLVFFSNVKRLKIKVYAYTTSIHFSVLM